MGITSVTDIQRADAGGSRDDEFARAGRAGKTRTPCPHRMLDVRWRQWIEGYRGRQVRAVGDPVSPSAVSLYGMDDDPRQGMILFFSAFPWRTNSAPESLFRDPHGEGRADKQQKIDLATHLFASIVRLVYKKTTPPWGPRDLCSNILGLLLPLTRFLRLLLLGIRRRLERVPAIDPDARELVLNLLPAGLPRLDLRQTLAELTQLLLDMHLFALGADALKRPLVALLAGAEDEVVRVVPLERRAGGDCDEGCASLLALCSYFPHAARARASPGRGEKEEKK